MKALTIHTETDAHGGVHIGSTELPPGTRVEVLLYPEMDGEADAASVCEQIVAYGLEIPAEERASMPKDLARNFDHYAYGAPKEE